MAVTEIVGIGAVVVLVAAHRTMVDQWSCYERRKETVRSEQEPEASHGGFQALLQRMRRAK